MSTYYEFQSLVSSYNQSHFSDDGLEYECLTSIVRKVKQMMVNRIYKRSYVLRDIISVITSTIPSKFTTLGLIVNSGDKILLHHFLDVCDNMDDIDVKSKFVVLDVVRQQESLETIKTIGFSTPVVIAARNGFSDILDILLNAGAKTQELYEEFFETDLSSYETNIISLKIYCFFIKSDIVTHSENCEKVMALERSLLLAFRVGLFDIVKLLINSCDRIYDPNNELISKLFMVVLIEDNIDMLYFLIQVGIFNKWTSLNFLKRIEGENRLIKRNLDNIISYLTLSGFTGVIGEVNCRKHCSLSLMDITRISLRNYFIHFTDARSIHIYLNKLKIPLFLIAFLKMEDLDL